MTIMRMMVIMFIILGTSTSWAGPLKVSESDIQYGSLKEGPPVVKKVLLTNVSLEEVVIANVKAS
jgi:hypothetical protein